MLVDCPDCSRSYHLAADDLGPDGRVVVCPRCRARWFQQGEAQRDRGETNGASWLSASVPPAEPPASRRSMSSGGRRAATAFAIIAVAAAGVACAQGRNAIVRFAPRTAALYAAAGWPVNVRGLAFAHVAPTVSAAADTTVAGEIRNVSHHRVRVPRLAFEARDGAGKPLVAWSETPRFATLAGGKTSAFASTPRRLPPASRTVVVRFEDDAATPIQVAAAR